MADVQGHRANGADEFWASAAVWWRWEVEEDGDDYVRWMVRPPCGHHFMLAGGSQPMPHHCVEEHEDGAITVEPNPPACPDNSNSILCPSCGWHGFLRHGVWTA